MSAGRSVLTAAWRRSKSPNRWQPTKARLPLGGQRQRGPTATATIFSGATSHRRARKNIRTASTTASPIQNRKLNSASRRETPGSCSAPDSTRAPTERTRCHQGLTASPSSFAHQPHTKLTPPANSNAAESGAPAKRQKTRQRRQASRPPAELIPLDKFH